MVLRRSRRGEEDLVPTGPAKVLVVHDDPEGCELLVRIVSQAGYQVTRAHDFREMSESLVVSPPTAVVLDAGSGGIGGNLKLLDAVRQHSEPAIAHSRVVLVATGSANAMFSWQAGIDELLQRPFHSDELLAALGDAIGRPEADRRHHRRRMVDAAGGADRS